MSDNDLKMKCQCKPKLNIRESPEGVHAHYCLCQIGKKQIVELRAIDIWTLNPNASKSRSTLEALGDEKLQAFLEEMR